MKFLGLIPLLLVIGTPLAAVAQRFPANYPIHSQIVRFKPGHTTAIVRGIARTPGIYEYRLRARAGQHMTVHLTSSNKGVEMTIYDPNNTDLALGIDNWKGTLETSGDYKFMLINNRSRVALNPSFVLKITIR